MYIFFFRGHSQKKPVFSLIDDCSRKVMECSLLPDHISPTILRVLLNNILTYGHPYSEWTDNGSEINSEFARFLQFYHIV